MPVSFHFAPRHAIPCVLGMVAMVAMGCEPAAPVVDSAATATSLQETTAAQSTAQAVAQSTAQAVAQSTAEAAARSTQTAAPAATSAAQATAVRNADFIRLEATATAQALRGMVEQAVAATAAAQPTATPVPPTSTPEPAPPTATPVPAAPPQAPIVIISPQYVPPPVPVALTSYSTPQFVMDTINRSNNAYATAKWSLNQNDLEAGIAGRELGVGRAYVQGLIQNRTRVVSTMVRGNITYWSYSTPTRVLASKDEVWRFVNYNADTYALKRDIGARLYRNDYMIDLVGGRWIVSLDSVPNPNGEAI